MNQNANEATQAAGRKPVAADADADSARLQPAEPAPIVFYDGQCGLCQRSVQFILDHDHQRRFHLAPLQGETAAGLLSPETTRELNTLVLLDEAHRTFRRSAAVVRILWRLSRAWQVLGTLLWLVPLPLRNLGYRIVAANRYRWFGKSDACRLPTVEERHCLLP